MIHLPCSCLRLYNTSDLSLIAEIDDFESSYFERAFFDSGSFEIVINQNLPHASLFQKGQIIQFAKQNNCLGFIETITEQFDKSGKGSEKLVISGYELKGITKKRRVIPAGGSARYSVTGPGETCLKSAMNYQGGPSTVDSNRIFPNLQIASDLGRGTTYTLSGRYSNLVDELYNCSLGTLTGWYIYLNPATKKLIFECSSGVNRAAGTAQPAIFTQRNGQLESGSHKSTYEGYENFIIAGGTGVGASRTIVTVPASNIPTGFNRIEGWLDGRELSTTPELTNKANAELASKIYTEYFDATALNSSQLQYRVNYDLGDIVTVQIFSTAYNVRITKIREYWAKGDYKLDLTFDKPIPELDRIIIDQNEENNTALNAGA